MSGVTVLVVCPDCKGERGEAVCGWCFGQGHIAVNRTPEGGVPAQFEEWIPPLLVDPRTPSANGPTQGPHGVR